MKRLVAGGLVLALAACAGGPPDVDVTQLADGRFLIGAWPSGELPDPDVLGTAMGEGEARCMKDGKTAEITFNSIQVDGKEMDEISYSCVDPK